MGDDHISNTDIYYVLAKGHTAMKNFKSAVENLSKMFEKFEKTYGFNSDKTAKICMEFGQLYEMANSLKDSIEYYGYAWGIWEKVLETNPSPEGYNMIVDVAIKMSELTHKSGKAAESYEILKACERKYEHTYESKKKKCLEIKRLLIKYSEEGQDLEANYNELIGFEVSKKKI
jgi:hypothetical protein